MTHISKRPLPEHELARLHDQIDLLIGSLSKDAVTSFFSTLLTPAERIMLTKRLGAIALFHQGHSAYRASELLLISPSTAARMHLRFVRGEYAPIVSLLTKRGGAGASFLEAVDEFLRMGMPPRGKGRWKYVFRAR